MRERERGRNTHDTSNILKCIKITNPRVILSIIACGMIFTWIVIKCNVDRINMNDGSDEKDKSMWDRKEEKSEWMKRMTNHMKRAKRSEIVKPRPHMEVGMMDHVPVTDLEMQCLYYPLTTDATKPYYINKVTYITIEPHKVDVQVDYQSVANETIVTRIFVLSALTSRPSVDFCNDVWENMTPKFYVHIDQGAYKEFHSIVLRAVQRKPPQVCVNAITGIIRYDLGFTKGCRSNIYILTSYPFPALDNVIWSCGENVYTFIPPNWQGTCAPYWIPKTAKFTSETEAEKDKIGVEDTQEIEWPNTTGKDQKANEVTEEDDTHTYKELNIKPGSGHPFESNLWYQSVKRRVRRLTQKSCYACSLLPLSTRDVFVLVAKPLKGPEGLPAFCTLAYMYVVQNHPKTGTHVLTTSSPRPIIRTNRMYFGKILNLVMKENNIMYKVTQYAIYSNISISQPNGQDLVSIHVTKFHAPGDHPSLVGCTSFYEKHICDVPYDLSATPTKSSAIVNDTDIFDLCLEGKQENDTGGGQNMGFVQVDKCRYIIDKGNDYAQLAFMGVPVMEGFYWCCGEHVWDSLPPRFKGRCGICILHDVTYVVEPVEYIRNNVTSSRAKREAREVKGYIHLRNTDPQRLAEQYYALDDGYQIYTHSQMVFASIFWNTELQYNNHYLIALTRHDLALMANSTSLALKSISSELDLIKRFANDNRVALDALTAVNGGVCAIVGEGCCTYLPSDSEGSGNLSIAIKNLRDIQESIVAVNRNARMEMGYRGNKIWENIAGYFGGNSVLAWLVGLCAPIIGIVLIVAIIMGCCFPIFRALIMKSVSSVSKTILVQNPIRNTYIYAPPEMNEDDDSTSVSSESSEDPMNNVD